MSFRFLIDWNDDTDFGESNENISAYVIQADWQLGMHEPYQLLCDEGAATFVVDNSTGYFLPEGTSAIAGSIRPGRRMRIDHVYSGATVVMWNGWIDHIEYNWEPAGSATGRQPVTIYGAGPQQMLQDTQIQLPTYYYQTTAGTIIRDILALVNLPPVAGSAWLLGVASKTELGTTTILANTNAYSDLDVGVTTFENYLQYDSHPAWDLISELTEAERGRFYFGRDGRAMFIDQNGRFLDQATEIALNRVGTVTESNTYKPNGMAYRYGYNVITSARVEGEQRNLADGEELLWQQNGGWGIPGPGTAYQWAKLARTTGEDVTATGVRIYSSTFFEGTAALTLEDRGAWQLITAINSGTVEATIVGLQLYGIPISGRNAIAAETLSKLSTGIYGRRNELSLNLPPLSTYDQLKRVANGEVTLRKNPSGEVVTLDYTTRGDGVDNAHLLRWSMGTALIVESTSLNHNRFYQIISETNSWELGNIHRCSYTLEANYSTNPYLLDSEIAEGGVA